MKSCIYQILNLVNGKFYIGHSQNYDIRWWEHIRKLRVGKHDNLHLQRAWTKYGEAAFEFILIELVDKKDMLSREQFWIDTLGACNIELGYNINPDATRPPSGLGSKRTIEQRATMSAAMIGIKKSTTENMKKPKSEETKEKIRQAHLGKTLSDAHKQSLREFKRETSTWPHDDGNKCECDGCKLRRNAYYRAKNYPRNRSKAVRINDRTKF